MKDPDVKQDFSQLIGKTIQSINNWDEGDKSFSFVADGESYNLNIDDDGCGCNDSNAFLESISGIENIIGKKIISVEEDSDSFGALIILKTESDVCSIVITHEQNGYYGFAYDLHKQ